MEHANEKCLLYLLVFWVINATCASVQGRSLWTDQDDSLHSLRHLVSATNPFPCGSILGTLQVSDIELFWDMFLQAFEPLATLQDSVLPLAKYDLQVVILCGSCAFSQGIDSLVPDESYCGEEVYGSNATHSAVALIPLLPNTTTNTFLPGALHGVIYMHGTAIDFGQVPTQSFPSILTAVIQSATANATTDQIDVFDFAEYMYALLAASAGAISILPDYLGYGASAGTHHRMYVQALYYQQAAVTTFLAAQTYIQQASQGCTTLSPVVTIHGASEGGYGAVAASAALSQLPARVLQVYSFVPILSPSIIAAFWVASFDQGLISPQKQNIYLQGVIPFLGYAFSLETPGVPNTGTGQPLLSSKWMVPGNFSRNILDWFSYNASLNDEEVWVLSPEYTPSVLNPNFLSMIQEGNAQNVTDPCLDDDLITPNQTDKLCLALTEASLWNIVLSSPYPIQLCYSADDTVIPTSNFPEDLFNNSNVTRYEGNASLPVFGDHGTAFFLCMASPLAALASNANGTDDTGSAYVIPLDDSMAAQCGMEMDSTPTSRGAFARPMEWVGGLVVFLSFWVITTDWLG